jgi:[ribosomal protein S18]-alanine N-acetyltransferase
MIEKNVAEKMIDSKDVPRIVRQMDTNDIDRIMEIERKSFVAPWSKTMFEETIFSPISRGFVIEHNNTIVGYIVFYTVHVEAHIMNLAVNPAERKQGYARQMLDQVLKFFRENSVSECYLEVREHNRIAQELYEHFGFEVIGRRKKYYPETGEDALVMQLFL